MIWEENPLFLETPKSIFLETCDLEFIFQALEVLGALKADDVNMALWKNHAAGRLNMIR